MHSRAPGRYLGGEPGSPLILLDAYLRHSFRDRIQSQIAYLFIEEREDRASHLRGEVAKYRLPQNVHVYIETGRYEDIFGQTLSGLRDAGRDLAPTFAFIDPFGYTQSPMRLTGEFFQFARCEALIYVPIRFMARFVTQPNQARGLTALFGTDDWQDAIQLEAGARRTFLHDLFLRQLHSLEDNFITTLRCRERRFDMPSLEGDNEVVVAPR